MPTTTCFSCKRIAPSGIFGMNSATNETMDVTRDDRPHRSTLPPVLSATGVAKRFDATVALSALDLSIGAGEVVALMGANGAGKSTFVKILSGALQADGGTLTLRGEPYRPASPHAAKRLGVATVHQSVADAVVPTLSIADNLLLDRLCDPASPWRVPPAARRRDRSPHGSADVAAAPLASLSLADQQRVTLARALAGQPSLLILDEPTASLSAAEAERLFVLVDALRRDGVAILLVSHRLGDLRRIADRAAIVRDGRIVADLAAPIDFDAAVETMIGRPLPRTRASVPERAGRRSRGRPRLQRAADAADADQYTVRPRCPAWRDRRDRRLSAAASRASRGRSSARCGRRPAR